MITISTNIYNTYTDLVPIQSPFEGVIRHPNYTRLNLWVSLRPGMDLREQSTADLGTQFLLYKVGPKTSYNCFFLRL